MNKLLIVVAAVLVSSCTPMSVAEIRDAPPSRSKDLPGNYFALGTCALEAFQTAEQRQWSISLGALMYESTHKPSAQRMTITGVSFGSGLKIPSVDVIFLGHADTTTVETRLGGIKDGIRSGVEKLQDLMWPIIEECSLQQQK